MSHLKNRCEALAKANKGQGKSDEYEYIASLLSDLSPCNLLVFGLGNDSGLWLDINTKGKTIFIEHESNWVAHCNKMFPDIDVFIPKYTTKRKQWKTFLDKPEKLAISLPDRIKDCCWDIIYIDGPQGGNDNRPGRMQSIYSASKLKYKNVLAHDCDRKVEIVYFNLFIGKPTHIQNRIFHFKKP